MSPLIWCKLVLTAREMTKEGRFSAEKTAKVEEDAKAWIRRRIEG